MNMSNMSDRSAIAMIVAEIEKSGSKAPKIVLAAHAQAVKVQAATRRLGCTHEALADAVADALANDRDPNADPDVVRLAVARQLTGSTVAATVDAAAVNQLRAVCREHADAIVTAWRPRFDEAAALLAEAGAHITSELDDATVILKSGSGAAAMWAETVRAVKAVEEILGAWFALAAFTRIINLNPHMMALRAAEIPWGVWTEQGYGNAGRRVSPWDLVRAGLRLSLPTFAEYRQRIAALDQARHDDERRAVEAERRAFAGLS